MFGLFRVLGAGCLGFRAFSVWCLGHLGLRMFRVFRVQCVFWFSMFGL